MQQRKEERFALKDFELKMFSEDWILFSIPISSHKPVFGLARASADWVQRCDWYAGGAPPERTLE